MTTYLTKSVDGQTHHFRATIDGVGVDIVEGVFYNWISKHWQGCGDKSSAEKRKVLLVDEKIKEGFTINEFKETPENTSDIYDKAKWHFSGDFPKDLDIFQGYVHTGMFLGWLIDPGLVSDEFRSNFEEETERFKKEELTGAKIFESCCDGVLSLEELSETGNRFALKYFDFTHGQYLSDYEFTLGVHYDSLYHVADTWDNYKKLKLVLDKRYLEWQNQ